MARGPRNLFDEEELEMEAQLARDTGDAPPPRPEAPRDIPEKTAVTQPPRPTLTMPKDKHITVTVSHPIAGTFSFEAIEAYKDEDDNVGILVHNKAGMTFKPQRGGRFTIVWDGIKEPIHVMFYGSTFKFSEIPVTVISFVYYPEDLPDPAKP